MLQLPFFQWNTIALGPLTIQVWGLFVATGMVIAAWILQRRARRFGFDSALLLDFFLWVVVGGFIGARFGHVFFYEPAYFLANPLEVVAIWHGGMSSFGGFIGSLIAGWVFVKRKKISPYELVRYADELIFVAVVGWMIGRVGCTMIHDHWGIPCNCPLAIKTENGPRLDMALLEIVALIPLAIYLFVQRKTKEFGGRLFPIVAVYYGTVRFFLDFLRATDISGADTRYLRLTPAQYFAILFVLWGIYRLYQVRRDAK